MYMNVTVFRPYAYHLKMVRHAAVTLARAGSDMERHARARRELHERRDGHARARSERRGGHERARKERRVRHQRDALA
jgi:hypothetical protein